MTTLTTASATPTTPADLAQLDQLATEDVTLAGFTGESASGFMLKAAIAADQLGVRLLGYIPQDVAEEFTKLLTELRTCSYLGGYYTAAIGEAL
jgi:hypothetical protein